MISYPKPIPSLIQQRYSCRTYQKIPLAPDLRAQLSDFAAVQTTGPLGGQARFGLVAATENDFQALKGLGTYGFIRDATGYLVGATDEKANKMEDFGYLLERFILYATGLELGTCWLGGTFSKTSFAQKIDAQPGELVPAVAAVGYIAKKRHWMEGLIRKGANAPKRRPWEQLFFDGDFFTPLLPENAVAYATPLEMVRIGPSASNKQPWRVLKDGANWHFYLQRTPGYREGRLNQLVTVADLQRMDLGIAMCHFELAARELGLQGEWQVAPPELALTNDLTEYTVSWVG